jgi:hypothetical protein
MEEETERSINEAVEKFSVGLGMIVRNSNPSYSGRGRDRSIRVNLGKIEKHEALPEKQTKSKRGGGVWLKWWSTCLASVWP